MMIQKFQRTNHPAVRMLCNTNTTILTNYFHLMGLIPYTIHQKVSFWQGYPFLFNSSEHFSCQKLDLNNNYKEV